MRKVLMEVIAPTRRACRAILTDRIDDIREYLITILPISEVESAIAELNHQRSDPKKFPNIIIFLDKENKMITIDDALADKMEIG
jgi:hypothetical protein